MLSTALGRFLQWIMGGWAIKGDLPNLKKYIIIVGHHTSNWDFPVLMSAKMTLGLKVNFLGKHTLFVGPMGWFMRKLGGIPIMRSHSSNMVEQIVNIINNSERFMLALTPEGTRSKVKAWKTGFYHIAHNAKIPIIPIALDFANNEIVVATPFMTTGDKEKDIQELHYFFRPYQPKNPELSCDYPIK